MPIDDVGPVLQILFHNCFHFLSQSATKTISLVYTYMHVCIHMRKEVLTKVV